MTKEKSNSPVPGRDIVCRGLNNKCLDFLPSNIQLLHNNEDTVKDYTYNAIEEMQHSLKDKIEAIAVFISKVFVMKYLLVPKEFYGSHK